jgi:hypothetical protein
LAAPLGNPGTSTNGHGKLAIGGLHVAPPPDPNPTPESLVHLPNIIELAKKNPIDRSLVLHMQWSLQDVGLKISKMKKSEISYDEFRRWEMSGGLDAAFSFCASGNIDHPEACAESQCGWK